MGEDTVELILAEQAVVDEDTGEVLADGAMQKDSGHGGVDTAREAKDYTILTNLAADLGYC